MSGTWLKKLRSVLTLGGIGGVLTGVVGGVWSLLSGILSGYLVPELVVLSAAWWAVFGGLSAAGFGVALAAMKSRRLHDITLAWAGLVGGATGAVACLGLISAFGGPSALRYVITDLSLLGFFATIGAGVTAGMVAIARGPPWRRLERESDQAGLLEGD